MFLLEAQKTRLILREKEPIVAGSYGIYDVHIDFSEEWDDVDRVVVFKNGQVITNVGVDENFNCKIPWEVIQTPGGYLHIGVYGHKDKEIIIPTMWAQAGPVIDGTTLGLNSEPYPDFVYPDNAIDHRLLSHKEDPNQHSISAISGLTKELNRIPVPMEPLTNIELEALLK